MPNVGNVWLRGRCELLLPDGTRAWVSWDDWERNWFDANMESGVKNGEVGLVGPAENDEGAVSVNTLESELVL